MKKTNSTFKPINKIEEKILTDKEFLIAIEIGRPRKKHAEGTIKNHIINILDYIEANYKTSKEYENLRVMALLHDVGKFAFLEKYLDKYLPDKFYTQKKKITSISKSFAEKYGIPKKYKEDMKEYGLSSEHAYVSYMFAKKFLKNKRILELLKYHDIAFDFEKIYRRTKTYDLNKFKEIFSKIDLEMYVLFMECDRCNPKNEILLWIKKELRRHKFIR